MKKLTIGSICFLLLGCAGPVKTTLKMPYEVSNSSFQILDQRPKNQKEQEIMSLNIGNCQYGSYQMGEINEMPSRVKVLENYLNHNLNESMKSKKIVLKNFVIHVNASAQLRGGLSNMYGGGVLSDALIQKKVVGCSNDDLYGGYSVGEVKDSFPPLIAIIDVEIEGKNYHSRALQSLGSNNWGEKNPKWNSLMQEIVIAASQNLVNAINEGKFANVK